VVSGDWWSRASRRLSLTMKWSNRTAQGFSPGKTSASKSPCKGDRLRASGKGSPRIYLKLASTSAICSALIFEPERFNKPSRCIRQLESFEIR
jgi:hypothetical protein